MGILGPSGKDEKMAKKDDEAGERAREFGADERVEKTKVNASETDLFDEVLKGPKKAGLSRAKPEDSPLPSEEQLGKLKAAMDKNEDEILGDQEDASEGDIGEDEPLEEDEGED